MYLFSKSPKCRQNVAKNRDTKELTAENQAVSSFQGASGGNRRAEMCHFWQIRQKLCKTAFMCALRGI